jgi:hypothetical protein
MSKPKTMTLNRLYRIIGKLIAEGHGREPVCVNKVSFSHALESDGAVILPVEDISIKCINILDEDGGIQMNKDGTERTRMTAVLAGGDEREADMSPANDSVR